MEPMQLLQRPRWLSRRGEPESMINVLRGGVDRLFEDFRRDLESGWPSFGGLSGLTPRDGGFIPRVEESADDQALHVALELPSVDPKDVDITLSDGLLTVRGEKKMETKHEGAQFFCCERSFGGFSRTIPLSASVDENKVAATFKNGVLMIDLPKTEEAKKKARHIEIKSG